MSSNELSGDLRRAGSGGSDESLEHLVALYLGRLNDGERLDRARILAEHPDLGEEILRDLESFVALRTGGDNNDTGSGPLGTLGDYTLRRQIGRGGMGVVYEAWQNSLDRQVALKVLPAGIAVDDRAFHRFMQEAKTAAKLSHPNVVGVFGMGVEANTPYFAMEFVAGETLSQVVVKLKDAAPEAESPFGKKDSVVYFGKLAEAFADVADGLQHAHSKGIIHRDIKPSNLILDRDGRLRILDFGLARLEGQESLTISGDVVGTPQYMSPEQARRKKIPVDHRTDVYSLGATLYEMLALQPPFRGKDHTDTLSQIIERDPVEPRKANPRVPKDLETIVLKCLRKQAANRYGTAEAMGQDLRRFVRGDAVEAKPQARWERARKRLWRVRWRIAAGMIVLASLATLGWQFAILRSENRTRLEREYEALVVRGILRLEMASFAEKSRGGEAAFSVLPGLGGAAYGAIGESAALALKDLDGAAALLLDKPDAPFHRARALFYLDREAEAFQAIESLLARRPPFIPAWTLKALLLFRRGEADGAERILAEAARLARRPWEKTWIEIWRDRKAGDHKKLIADYTALLAQGMEGREPFIGCTIVSRVGRGKSALDAKDPAQALRDFSVTESLAPGAVEPLILAGKAWELLGHAEEAARVFEDAYTRAANQDDVAVAVSYVYAELKKDVETEAWTKRIEDPAFRERRLMEIYYELGRWPEAIAAGRSALQRDPENAGIFRDLSFYLTQQNRFAESREVLDEGLRKWPEDPAINCHMAWNCLYEKRFDEAARYAEKILASPNRWHGAAQLLIGNCRIREGRIQEGEAALKAALVLQPKAPYIYRNAAWSFLMIGKTQEALRYLDQAIDIEPTSAYAHNNKGIALAREGRLDEAIASSRTAQSLSPWLPHPGIALSHVFLVQGKPGDALREYLTILERIPGDRSYWSSASRISALLRRHAGTFERGELEAAAEVLQRSVEKAPGNTWVADALAQSLIAIGGNQHRTRAATVAVSGLLRADGTDAGLSELGQTLAGLLDHAPSGDGVREAAVAAVKTPPSFAAIDILAAAAPDAAFLEAARARLASTATAEPAKELLIYLEAKALARAGRHAEAAARTESLVALEPEAVEPEVLFAAELLAAGDFERAEQSLRAVLESGPRRDRRLWDAWLRLRFVEQGRGAGEVPARLPAPPIPAAAQDGAASNDYRDDARWLLERLAQKDAVRINCGGEEYRDPGGRVWGKDRFALGGEAAKPWAVEDREDIAGTDADPLFWTERAFDFRDAGKRAGYAIPLPPGRYGLRLLFAELFFKTRGLCRFEIVIQGETVLRGFEPIEAGVATATEKVFEANVKDGLLEIRFVHDLWDPKLSAIEIERVE